MLFDTRRIQAFLAIAEELNFTRAAERLGIAQQPLSQQIARIERDLGVPLFSRSTRRVALTQAGSSLYRDVVDLLARMDTAERNALRAARGETGRIAIGAGTYAIDTILPDVMHRFHERYPHVEISLYEHHTAQQIDALRSGDVDIAFAIEAPALDDVAAETVHTGGFVLVVAARETAITAPVHLGDYPHAAYIAAPRHLSPGMHDAKQQIFRDHGVEPHVAQYASQASTMFALVAAGAGWMLTPASPSRVERVGIRFVPIAHDRSVKLAMMTRAGDADRTVVQNFCAIAREVRDASGWIATCAG
jgi:DNA-binding transcriptional LysR family regulator